jgi:hydroxymethylpyrimidine pyrophosphatase-like HAD family hydrolase
MRLRTGNPKETQYVRMGKPMAAFFVDLDGTTFYFGTNNPLPNALENLREWQHAGHQIIFTTLRGDVSDIREVLIKAGLNCLILTDIQSPRVVINDDGAKAINHQKDAPWKPV